MYISLAMIILSSIFLLKKSIKLDFFFINSAICVAIALINIWQSAIFLDELNLSGDIYSMVCLGIEILLVLVIPVVYERKSKE